MNLAASLKHYIKSVEISTERLKRSRRSCVEGGDRSGHRLTRLLSLSDWSEPVSSS